DFVTLLHTHVNRVRPEIAVFDQVAREAAAGAACGRVFRDSEQVGKHACVQLVLGAISLGGKKENHLGFEFGYEALQAIEIDVSATDSVESFERNDEEQQAGRDVLDGEAGIKIIDVQIQDQNKVN